MVGDNERFSVTGITQTRRIPELDGLRGIAIATVLVFHYVMLEQPDVLLSAKFLACGAYCRGFTSPTSGGSASMCSLPCLDS
jgi:hypothetical protein